MNDYTILGISVDDRMDKRGRSSKVFRVEIETENGTVGTVDVAEKDYTEDRLPALLSDAAERFDLPYTLTRGG
jgi:hypothetical protein